MFLVIFKVNFYFFYFSRAQYRIINFPMLNCHLQQNYLLMKHLNLVKKLLNLVITIILKYRVSKTDYHHHLNKTAKLIVLKSKMNWINIWERKVLEFHLTQEKILWNPDPEVMDPEPEVIV